MTEGSVTSRFLRHRTADLVGGEGVVEFRAADALFDAVAVGVIVGFVITTSQAVLGIIGEAVALGKTVVKSSGFLLYFLL